LQVSYVIQGQLTLKRAAASPIHLRGCQQWRRLKTVSTGTNETSLLHHLIQIYRFAYANWLYRDWCLSDGHENTMDGIVDD